MVSYLFAAAVARKGCPVCKQEPGAKCKTPKGRIATAPHVPRRELITRKFSDMRRFKEPRHFPLYVQLPNGQSATIASTVEEVY